ncbi:hypothetical protein IV203_015946 [Nitzschia inconspicua]|uniref:Uncharacterized protein n=1 Tax=Nitzschia inconspicua TaxID=303405 RepID=A0A9K3KPU9_9STRA|nr:hypothetical protein IV203_015946 [Nitzschia inconspicua]
MLTADRVMGDPRARYVPCASLDECPGVGAVQQPGDLAAVQGIANIANDPTGAVTTTGTICLELLNLFNAFPAAFYIIDFLEHLELFVPNVDLVIVLH